MSRCWKALSEVRITSFPQVITVRNRDIFLKKRVQPVRDTTQAWLYYLNQDRLYTSTRMHKNRVTTNCII